jgi:surfactin synthase thioesterase subunit
MKKLKTIILMVAVLFFSSCSAPIDELQAQKLVEELLQEIDSENYSNLSNYYTASFNAGESEEARADKFERLRSAVGKIKSYEVTNTEHSEKFAYPIHVVLTYKIERTYMPTIEKFVVIRDEGSLKVSNHGITN